MRLPEFEDTITIGVVVRQTVEVAANRVQTVRGRREIFGGVVFINASGGGEGDLLGVEWFVSFKTLDARQRQRSTGPGNIKQLDEFCLDAIDFDPGIVGQRQTRKVGVLASLQDQVKAIAVAVHSGDGRDAEIVVAFVRQQCVQESCGFSTVVAGHQPPIRVAGMDHIQAAVRHRSRSGCDGGDGEPVTARQCSVAVHDGECFVRGGGLSIGRSSVAVESSETPDTLVFVGCSGGVGRHLQRHGKHVLQFHMQEVAITVGVDVFRRVVIREHGSTEIGGVDRQYFTEGPLLGFHAEDDSAVSGVMWIQAVASDIARSGGFPCCHVRTCPGQVVKAPAVVQILVVFEPSGDVVRVHGVDQVDGELRHLSQAFFAVNNAAVVVAGVVEDGRATDSQFGSTQCVQQDINVASHLLAITLCPVFAISESLRRIDRLGGRHGRDGIGGRAATIQFIAVRMFDQSAEADAELLHVGQIICRVVSGRIGCAIHIQDVVDAEQQLAEGVLLITRFDGQQSAGFGTEGIGGTVRVHGSKLRRKLEYVVSIAICRPFPITRPVVYGSWRRVQFQVRTQLLSQRRVTEGIAECGESIGAVGTDGKTERHQVTQSFCHFALSVCFVRVREMSDQHVLDRENLVVRAECQVEVDDHFQGIFEQGIKEVAG